MLLKNVDKPIEEFSTMVFNMKNSLENLMYPNLTIFVQAFFALSHSSAAAERIFSQLTLMKTKK